MTGERTVFTPSQVGQYIKSYMDRDAVLSGLLVRGEISNYKLYPSGHHYFTLKDAQGALKCVMFRGDAGSHGIIRGILRLSKYRSALLG